MPFTFGNQDNLMVFTYTHNDTYTLGNGAGDTVFDLLMGNTIILGSGDGDTVNALYAQGRTDFSTIILGSGAGDTVNIGSSVDSFDQFSTVTLGNGAGDTVNALNLFHATISLGSGDRDSVQIRADLSPPSVFTPNDNTVTLGNGNMDSVLAHDVNGDTYILGDGAGDSVTIIRTHILNSPVISLNSNNTIILGNGNNDFVEATLTVDNIISVGNGKNDIIHAGFDSTVTLGKGGGAVVAFLGDFIAGTIGQNGTITNFDPGKDVIQLPSQLENLGPGPQFAVFSIGQVGGNAVITDGLGDTITVVGVQSTALHIGGNVQYVDLHAPIA